MLHDPEKALPDDKPYVLLLFLQRILNRWTFEFIDPLGLMALAAYIAEKGYEPGVFTGPVSDAVKLLHREQEKRSVAVVGLYCDFENQSVVESFSLYLKENLKVPVIVGGPQAVALGVDFLAASKCDAVARGEGEQTLHELLAYFLRGQGELGVIEGISFLDDNDLLVKTPDRRPLKDLDALPRQRASHSLTEAKNNISLLTGRGCPFTCAFCHQGSRGNSIRLRSVKSVCHEIELLLEENPKAKYLWFADDTFTLDQKRVKQICVELTRLRSQRDFIWFCEGHPSTLVKWPHMVGQMVEAGLTRLQIGIESGSKEIIDSYQKHTTLEQIEEAVHICREAGLAQLCGNIIIGGAHESQKSLEETWQFVHKLLGIAPGMLDISLTLFMPYPHTAITNAPGDFGLSLTDPLAITSIGDYPVVETQSLRAPEIAQARRDFFQKLYERMSALLKNDEIPHDLILRHYSLRDNYDITSIWLSAIYAKEHNLHRRYTLLNKTTASIMKDIPDDELLAWHPLRVMNLWNSITWQEETPFLGDWALSPFEYELIIQCSGKMPLKTVLDNISRMFADRFESRAESEAMALNYIGEFEKRNWLVFMPY